MSSCAITKGMWGKRSGPLPPFGRTRYQTGSWARCACVLSPLSPRQAKGPLCLPTLGHGMYVSVCLTSCLPACLPVCRMPSCLSFSLPAKYLPSCSSACLRVSLYMTCMSCVCVRVLAHLRVSLCVCCYVYVPPSPSIIGQKGQELQVLHQQGGQESSLRGPT